MNNKGFIQLQLGEELHYKKVGVEYWESPEKPVILFLHEGLGSIPQWKNYPETLCSQLQLPGLIYERIGYGKSTMRNRNNDFGYMHKEALEYLPQVVSQIDKNREIILYGHSDGGSIALIHAAKFPERILAVVSEAAHVFVEEITLVGILEAVFFYEQPDRKFHEKLRRYHGEHTDTVFYNWADTWLSKMFEYWNIEAYLPAIQAPTLIIQGADDQYGSLKQVQAIEEGIPAPTVTFIPENCGHHPFLQQQESVMKRAINFLECNVGLG